VTRLGKESRGDLHVHIDVTTPTKLTEAQEDLLRQLAELRGETRPTGRLSTTAGGGMFGKIKDRFAGR
jgi:molecular chaperone DnaJ